MTVSLERCVEMQLYIATEKPKKGFGKLSKEESEVYDSIVIQFENAKEKGLVLEVANAGVTPVRKK